MVNQVQSNQSPSTSHVNYNSKKSTIPKNKLQKFFWMTKETTQNSDGLDKFLKLCTVIINTTNKAIAASGNPNVSPSEAFENLANDMNAFTKTLSIFGLLGRIEELSSMDKKGGYQWQSWNIQKLISRLFLTMGQSAEFIEGFTNLFDIKGMSWISWSYTAATKIGPIVLSPFFLVQKGAIIMSSAFSIWATAKEWNKETIKANGAQKKHQKWANRSTGDILNHLAQRPNQIRAKVLNTPQSAYVDALKVSYADTLQRITTSNNQEQLEILEASILQAQQDTIKTKAERVKIRNHFFKRSEHRALIVQYEEDKKMLRRYMWLKEQLDDGKTLSEAYCLKVDNKMKVYAKNTSAHQARQKRTIHKNILSILSDSGKIALCAGAILGSMFALASSPAFMLTMSALALAAGVIGFYKFCLDTSNEHAFKHKEKYMLDKTFATCPAASLGI